MLKRPGVINDCHRNLRKQARTAAQMTQAVAAIFTKRIFMNAKYFLCFNVFNSFFLFSLSKHSYSLARWLLLTRIENFLIFILLYLGEYNERRRVKNNDGEEIYFQYVIKI
jgi:hypothetical protein